MTRILAIAVAALLVAPFVGCTPAEESEWIVVSQDTLIVGVDIEGTLKAVDSTSIGPPGLQSMWRFTIADITTDGEVVEEGAMLVSFDSNELQERLQAKENHRDSTLVTLEKRRFEISLSDQDEALALAEAEAAVRKAAIGADQSSELTGSLILQNAKLDLEAAKDNVEHLRKQMKRRRANNQREIATRESWVRTAEKAVKNLERDIAKLTVKAPRAGTAVLNEHNGTEKFKVGDQTWRSATILQVASLDKMMAEGTIDEADFGQLALGQKIHLRLEAHPDSEVEGALSEVPRSVQQKSWTEPAKVATVQLTVSAVEGIQLRPGMRFRGEVETERIENAVIVPLSSVFSSSEGPIAFRESGGSAERRNLVLGKRGKRGVQVLKGLSAGDKVSRHDLRRQP
jgi:HlyD family secretion protein